MMSKTAFQFWGDISKSQSLRGENINFVEKKTSENKTRKLNLALSNLHPLIMFEVLNHGPDHMLH